MKNIAVILAGGSGLRLGHNKPKQFLKVAGKLIIEHTIDVFQKHELVDEIAIVCHQDYIEFVEELISKNETNKVKKILNGGVTRSDSSMSAIKAYEFENDINLIFHDAVRPMVTKQIISNCLQALKKYNAVDVAILATDTIIEVKNNFISSIPDRNKLRRGQTPQAFKLKTIKKAYSLALKDPNFIATDDCGVVSKYLPNEKIYVVDGIEKNIKLTYEEDLFLLDKLFQLKSLELNDNHELDELKNKVLIVFGSSSGIGNDIIGLAASYGCKTYGFSRKSTNTDISSSNDVRDALNTVFQKEGRIDFIINTAGVLHKEPLHNMEYSDMEEIINTNYLGSVVIAKEAFSFLKQSQGTLVLFTSSSYTRGRANYSIYSSSKAAVVNLTQALADEWDTFNIKINCVNPERTLTSMRIKNFGNEDHKTLLKSVDVAMVALLSLLEDISGEIIDVKNI